MWESEITYSTIQNELTRRVLQQAFSGPLALLWSIGLLAFIALFERPLFAVIWSVAVVTLGLLMAADYRRTPNVRERVIRSIIQRRFPAHLLTGGSFQSAVDKGLNALTETTLKICQWAKAKDPEAHLHRLIPLSHRMAFILLESIREAVELERGVNLAKDANAEDDVYQTDEAAGIPRKHQQSLEEIRRGAEQARLTVNHIVEQLETLMLMVFQLEPIAGDPARNLDLVREADAMLTWLEGQVEARLADRYGAAEVQLARHRMAAGFSQINASDGLSALQRLDCEYAQLHLVLERKRATDPSCAHVSASVGETYRIGLGLLDDVLELMRIALPSERVRLEAEVIDLEKRIETLRAAEFETERVKPLEFSLVSHLQRLDLMDKQHLRIGELLQLCARCEVALQRTRMELAALKTADSEMSVDQAIENLRRTIDRAKEVQDELIKLGF